MTVKVGDTVMSLIDRTDITKGNEYIVRYVYDGGDIMVDDNVGDENRLPPHEFKLVNTETETQYIRILEAILGQDAVKIARDINEALNNAP